MTSALSLLALLVAFPLAMLAIRVAGTYLLRGRRSESSLSADDLAALQALQVSGFASERDVAALTPREQRFVAGTAGRQLRLVGVPVPGADGAAAADRAREREVALGPFVLACPACGAGLGNTADVAHYVGSCPACSRRVAARRHGARVSLTTADEPRPGRRPTR